MLFHEKLYTMRKERGLSQVALAVKLGTTRQAVSKWETGQGYPETEKLLMLATLFDVTVDYLLKDTAAQPATDDKGYYVSQELAEGFLMNQRRWSRRFAAGVAVLLLAIGAYLRVEHEGANPLFLIGILVVGGCLTLRGILSSDRKYDKFAKEPLLFDGAYLRSLSVTSEKMNRRYIPLFAGSFVVFMVSIWVLASDWAGLPKDFTLGVPAYLDLTVIALAMSAAILFYAATMAESYGLLAKNEDHIRGFWFRLTRKSRQKMDDFFQ